MAVTIQTYNEFLEKVGDGTIDLDTDTFKCELYNNSHAFSAAHGVRADIAANALATGNGYTNPGQNLSAITWGFSVDKTIWNAANVSWAASGGSIDAYHAVILCDNVSDDLGFSINFGQLESAGAGTNFVIDFNDANGIFYIS